MITGSAVESPGATSAGELRHFGIARECAPNATNASVTGWIFCREDLCIGWLLVFRVVMNGPKECLDVFNGCGTLQVVDRIEHETTPLVEDLNALPDFAIDLV